MLAIGIMSGTSLDGVDACLVDIKKGKNSKFNIVYFTYVPYDKELKQRILSVSSNKPCNIQTICSLNIEISKAYVKAVKKLLKDKLVHFFATDTHSIKNNRYTNLSKAETEIEKLVGKFEKNKLFVYNARNILINENIEI